MLTTREEIPSSYIAAFHLESPGKSLTRPGWTRRTRCVHPAERPREGREREWREMAQRQDEALTSHLQWLYFHKLCPVLFMMSLLGSSENGARRLLQVRCYFLPRTWLSPEIEICHLWSLVRRMLLAQSLKITAGKHTTTTYGEQRRLAFSSHFTSRMWSFCPTG